MSSYFPTGDQNPSVSSNDFICMLKLFDTLSVPFDDKKDSLLQCAGFDASFNLSQFLMVSINALIAGENDQFHL